MKTLLAATISILSISCIGVSEVYRNSDAEVYIMDTGVRYHLESCRHVTEEARKVALGFAVDRGFSSCPVCRAPVLEEAEQNKKQSFAFAAVSVGLTLLGLIGIPLSARRVVLRRRAERVLSCRSDVDWEGLSVADKKTLVGEYLKEEH